MATETHLEFKTVEQVTRIMEKYGKLFPKWGDTVSQEYRFIKKLGKGAYGQVYQVQRRDDNKKYACKVLEKSQMKARHWKAVHDEVDLMNAIGHHPAMVDILEGFETSRRVYLVTCLCEGGDLKAWLSKKTKVDSQDIAKIFKQLFEGVAFLHKKGIIHSDIKPANILMKNRDSVDIMLTDFGVSQFHDRMVWCTRVSGTPSYMAPEMLTMHFSDSVDMWALGIMLFEMFHGYRPFSVVKGSAKKTIALAKKGFINEEREGRGNWFNKSYNIPKHAKDLIVLCLDLVPQKRIDAQEAMVHPFITHEKPIPIHMDALKDYKLDNHVMRIRKFVKCLVSCDVDSAWLNELMKETFSKADRTNSGFLNFDDFKHCVREIWGKFDSPDKPSSADLEIAFSDMDMDHNGKVDYDEFVKWYSWEYMKNQDDRAWDVLSNLNIDEDGNILKSEVQRIIANNQDICSRYKSAVASMERLWENTDKISAHDFVHTFCR